MQAGKNKREEKWSYRLVALLVEVNRCLVAVQPDASQQMKTPLAIVMARRVRWEIFRMPKKQPCTACRVTRLSKHPVFPQRI